MKEEDIRDIELDLLLEGIHRRYGYDFRHYARASLRRRVANVAVKLGMDHISQIIHPILRVDAAMSVFLREMSISVTEMFRDPDFFVALREKVLPYLDSYPFLKIWHAGCSTGEEAYAMAIVLKEEGLFRRSRIYATDFNNESLHTAEEGIYPLDKLKKYMANYNRSNGRASFSDYYHAEYKSAKMSSDLRKCITFANHNLVTDGVFGEMNLIVCRNVMIYFDKDLQNRVLRLLSDSLCHRGFLCLGPKESLRFSHVAADFDVVSKAERIFRKRRFPSGPEYRLEEDCP